MARRIKGSDASCWYKGKKLGDCTVSDSDAFVTLMDACGDDPNKVLREYGYFSPELKEILEKAVKLYGIAG